MKKLVALVLCLIMTGFFGITFASSKTGQDVYNAIMKYKDKNYTGCIQDMEAVLKQKPDEILAKYYMALGYTQIGMKEEAKNYYQQVVDQNRERALVKYSKLALTCLDNADSRECKKGFGKEEDDDMSEFIKSGDFLHPDLEKRIQDRELNDIKNTFNNDRMPDMSDYRFINDASSEIPTDAEIAAAVKVLAKVGFNPLGQMSAQNAQMAQFGLIGQNQDNNAFTNMLPYIMAQNTNKSNMSPELIQAMLMNQAMPGFDFNTNN